jgi:demethylmenaquinone methyltransferase/2-methoxy-6-polyprenyl-1,4-benzoquinol methylase
MNHRDATPQGTSYSAGLQGLPQNDVSKMFDRISPRYDLLNRLLSAGTDMLWRKKLTRLLAPYPDQEVLDIATGTADQIIAFFEKTDRVRYAVGIDLAQKMIEKGQTKIEKRGIAKAVGLLMGDATDIPARDGQFDAVTISFGIRNVSDVNRALREMYRVVKPGGRALILEFGIPQNRFLRCVARLYLRHILPNIGAWVSGDPYAYQYLNETIEAFPSGEAFCDLLRDASFTGVVAYPLQFGLPTIYRGSKPA